MDPINDVEVAVSATESALARFDELTATVKAKQSEIAELQTEHATTADTSVEFAKRLKLHTVTSSALVLHQADLLTLESEAAAQKRKVIATGAVALESLRNASGHLRALAQGQAMELIDQHFERAHVGAMLSMLLFAHKLTRAIPAFTLPPREDDEKISYYRRLREQFEPLRVIAAKLLPEPKHSAFDAPVSAMAEPVAV
jgi:hypothetical protein